MLPPRVRLAFAAWSAVSVSDWSQVSVSDWSQVSVSDWSQVSVSAWSRVSVSNWSVVCVTLAAFSSRSSCRRSRRRSRRASRIIFIQFSSKRAPFFLNHSQSHYSDSFFGFIENC
ncbi:hypothetical protein [Methanimicrococcus hongohii]|uniref:hypothetical protein n=1 Tax=Methanimicrococcus hongohii TaxID=3028295 RepID=UPI00292F520B|nr:hypothetical protein [Methanimicrococcus sp. Hf6]